jgi:hypothetical protein
MDGYQEIQDRTVEKYRAVIKKFYKMVYGNNEYYPDCVKWFAVKVGKDKHSQERGLDIAELNYTDLLYYYLNTGYRIS